MYGINRRRDLGVSPMPSTAAVTKQDSDALCHSGGTATSNRLAAISFGKSSLLASGISDLNQAAPSSALLEKKPLYEF